MPCVICGKASEATKYRCPKCGSKYCSVVCYKEHKLSCLAIENKNSESTQPLLETISPEVEANQFSKFERILQDETVQGLLRCEGIEQHLRLIIKILEDPVTSGEHSQEGRRLVALKKIRELRKGGREANAAIEDLATKVIELLNATSSEP